MVTRDTRTHEIGACASRARLEAAPSWQPPPPAERRPDRSRAAAATSLRRAGLVGFAGDTLGLGAARQRRPAGRPIVQVSPPARAIVGRVPRSRTRWSNCAPARGASPTPARPTPSFIDGLEASSQNRWPSLRFDLLAVNRLLFAVFRRGVLLQDLHVAGARSGRSSMSRRSAAPPASAAPPTEPDPDHYEKANAFCDVLVIGSGPAGLMAALAAGRAGARVHPRRRGFRVRRPAAEPKDARSTTPRPSLASTRRWPNSQACPMCA